MAEIRDTKAFKDAIKKRPPLSRPIGVHDWQGFKEDNPEQARRRRLRQRRDKRDELALFILENDPDVTTMAQARKKADEQLEIELEVEKGFLDPTTGEPTAKGKKRKETSAGVQRPRAERGGSRRQSTSPRRGRPQSGRTTRRVERFATRSLEQVAAPFGSVASAAWTFAMGALSVLLFYLLLQREGVGLVTSTTRALFQGILNFTNPWIPLFGSKAETSPPPKKTTVTRQQKRRIKKAVGHRPGASTANPELFKGGGLKK